MKLLKNLINKYLKWNSSELKSSTSILENRGYCPTCDSEVTFVARDPWLRDHYICTNCGSIPRERALMSVVEMYFPQWRDSIVHESSPVNRGASERLSRECSHYIPSQFFRGSEPGIIVNGIRCENLESLTFEDESIDLHITQDVMEHIFHPSKAFQEIARTLKPGGAHVFTVPIVNKNKPSKFRTEIGDNGEIIYLEPAVYHGNPISEEGSLVTVDWGFDICRYIFESCGLFTQLVYIDDIGKGIRAELIEVLITFKPGSIDR